MIDSFDEEYDEDDGDVGFDDVKDISGEEISVCVVDVNVFENSRVIIVDGIDVWIVLLEEYYVIKEEMLLDWFVF